MTTQPTIDVRPLIERGLVDDARWVAEATSTNSLLLTASPFSDEPGVYLLGADTQTAGRGRNANRWRTTSGALTFSLLLQGTPNPELLAFRVALAVCEAVDPHVSDAAEIKWPNDVLLAGKKLSGILIEQRPGVGTVVGVGINVNNRVSEADASVREQMTSLADAASENIDRAAVLTSFLERVRVQLAAEVGSVLNAFASRDALRGRQVVILDGPDGEVRRRGVAAGLAADGGLLIKEEGSTSVVHSGSVRLV